MANYFILIITALVVSIDSFVVGFGVSLNKKSTLALPCAVALVTLLMCCVTSFIGSILYIYLEKYVNLLGGFLLFCLGVANLLKRENETINLNTLSIKQSLIVGFTVGLDGAVANLSLVGYGFGALAPLVFGLTHFITVFLGQKLANKIHVDNTNILSGVTLVSLGVLKVFG